MQRHPRASFQKKRGPRPSILRTQCAVSRPLAHQKPRRSRRLPLPGGGSSYAEAHVPGIPHHLRSSPSMSQLHVSRFSTARAEAMPVELRPGRSPLILGEHPRRLRDLCQAMATHQRLSAVSGLHVTELHFAPPEASAAGANAPSALRLPPERSRHSKPHLPTRAERFRRSRWTSPPRAKTLSQRPAILGKEPRPCPSSSS